MSADQVKGTLLVTDGKYQIAANPLQLTNDLDVAELARRQDENSQRQLQAVQTAAAKADAEFHRKIDLDHAKDVAKIGSGVGVGGGGALDQGAQAASSPRPRPPARACRWAARMTICARVLLRASFPLGDRGRAVADHVAPGARPRRMEEPLPMKEFFTFLVLLILAVAAYVQRDKWLTPAAPRRSFTSPRGRRPTPPFAPSGPGRDVLRGRVPVGAGCPHGVVGFVPGQMVRFVSADEAKGTLMVTDGAHQAEVNPMQITNDLDIAAIARRQDQASQGAVAIGAAGCLAGRSEIAPADRHRPRQERGERTFRGLHRLANVAQQKFGGREQFRPRRPAQRRVLWLSLR